MGTWLLVRVAVSACAGHRVGGLRTPGASISWALQSIACRQAPKGKGCGPSWDTVGLGNSLGFSPVPYNLRFTPTREGTGKAGGAQLCPIH